MSFKEDVFAKIITYITIAVLLGAMLVEAFVIYTERSEKNQISARLDEAQTSISNLTAANLSLAESNQELQEFKDSWQDLVILADDEICQRLREELQNRTDVIPQEALQEAALAAEADGLEVSIPAGEEAQGEEAEAEEASASMNFSFPSATEREWLIPLNLGNEPSSEYLFYVRAEDAGLERYIDLLYEIPLDEESGEIRLDEDGKTIWECMAFDAGTGWQLILREEETEQE